MVVKYATRENAAAHCSVRERYSANCITNIVAHPYMVSLSLSLLVAAQTCYTGSSDCFGGNTYTTLSTYDACCDPLRTDSSVRRSFELANGVCSECIRKYYCSDHSEYQKHTINLPPSKDTVHACFPLPSKNSLSYM